MEIKYVPTSSIDEAWDKCRPMILKALTKGAGNHYTEEFYKQKLHNDEMVMIVAEESEVIACGILSVIEYPKDKSVFVELLAGKSMGEWLHLVEPILKKYRDHVGATTIEASCRPGLVKALTNWRPKAVLMELK